MNRKEIIARTVSDYYHLNFKEFLYRKRGKGSEWLAHKRQIAIYFMYKMLINSLPKHDTHKTVSDYFKYKHNSIVKYSSDTVKDILSYDKQYQKEIPELEKLIKKNMNNLNLTS